MIRFDFALDEDLTDERLESLCQGRVGNVALVLIKFARSEQAARRNKHLLQLVHDGRFADARIAGHKHELRSTVRHDTVEGREQCANLALSTIQLFGNHQPVWNVLPAKRELVDMMPRFPLVETSPKITLQAHCGLVSLLSCFGE